MKQISALLGLALTALLCVSAARADFDSGSHVFRQGEVEDNLYLAGGNVRVDARAAGDVVVAGGRVLIAREVGGDVLAAGGQVEIAARVLDDVRAAGGQVRLGGDIGGDALAAGGHVWLLPEAAVGKRAWLAGNSVEVDGRIAGELRAAASEVTIAGTVEGDVMVQAESLRILPSARINGSLLYHSPKEAQIEPGASIAGEVTHRPLERPDVPSAKKAARGAAVLFLCMLLVAGIVYFLLFPRFSVAAAEAIGERPWASLGLGVAVLFATPPVAVALMITAVGALLGLVAFMLYLPLLLVGFLTGMLFAGGLLLRLVGRGGTASRGWRVLSLLVAFVVLGLLGLVPVLGFLLTLAALVFGLGATVLRLSRVRRASQAPAAEPAH